MPNSISNHNNYSTHPTIYCIFIWNSYLQTFYFLISEISPRWTLQNFAECHIFGNFTSRNIAEFCRMRFWFFPTHDHSLFWKFYLKEHCRNLQNVTFFGNLTFFVPTCLFDPDFFTIWPGFFTIRPVPHTDPLNCVCWVCVSDQLNILFVFAEFFYLAPCSSMHLPSYRENKPRRDCSLWCLSCIVPCEVIIFEVVLCAVGPLVSKYLSLNTISSTSCLFWLEFTVSEEKPCASGTQGCSLLPSLKFIPFVLQSVILDATVWQSTTVENLNPTT